MGLFLGSLSPPSPTGPPQESISNNESACVDHSWLLRQALCNLYFTAPWAFCSSDVQCPGRTTAGAFRLWSWVEGRLVLGGSSGVLSCNPHGSLLSWLQKLCWLTPPQTSGQADPLGQGPRVPVSASRGHSEHARAFWSWVLSWEGSQGIWQCAAFSPAATDPKARVI